MKVTEHETTLVLTREKGDPKFYGVVNAKGESGLFHFLKKFLNTNGYGFDLIKKRMARDGHLVDDLQQYLRTRKAGPDPSKNVMIWNAEWAIAGAEEAWNRGRVTLQISRNALTIREGK